MANQPKIGFIGIGLMGTPMTRRLIDAGYQVAVWGRSPEKTKPLVQHGAIAVQSIADLVQFSDIIMLCVSDTEAVESIVFSDGGVIDFARPGQVLVDFSSIDPQKTRKFANELYKKAKVHWVDAPVSGGVAGATSGRLVVMAGGDEHVINDLRPVLDHLSQRVTYMGPQGSGQTTKLCNQILVGCNVLVMAEVLALAEKAGVESAKIPEALKGGFADSIPLQITGVRMANRDFDEVKWHVQTLLKDLMMAWTLTESIDGHTPMANLAMELMRKYADSGFAELDPSTLIQVYIDK